MCAFFLGQFFQVHVDLFSVREEATSALERFMFTRTGGSVDILLTYGGTEFKGELQVICEWLKIKCEMTPLTLPHSTAV